MVETDSLPLSADQIVILQQTFLWGRINRRTPIVHFGGAFLVRCSWFLVLGLGGLFEVVWV